MRVGLGFDAHQFAASGRVLLAGVVAEATRGVAATSDGDVAAHAVSDALLGAAALGDIGEMFPSGDPQWRNADSMGLLSVVVQRLADSGFRPASVDVTVIAQSVGVAPHRTEMRHNLASVLGLTPDAVSVKATTTDHMGYLGRDEGIAAMAVVTLASQA